MTHPPRIRIRNCALACQCLPCDDEILGFEKEGQGRQSTNSVYVRHWQCRKEGISPTLKGCYLLPSPDLPQLERWSSLVVNQPRPATPRDKRP